MWWEVGNYVHRLERIGFGSLRLDACLSVGSVRQLSGLELANLYAEASLTPADNFYCATLAASVPPSPVRTGNPEAGDHDFVAHAAASAAGVNSCRL